MYIQEVVLDGFKSYAHRTSVQGFDPHFNAITGLNGSGKSNILDAICFVLGITNLSQVRAGSLAELIYKQGQAGVTKASVTIVFNNDDRDNSPVGYEEHHEVTVTRQISIGGKSKYLINGRNSQANAVQNLFHSVQLNVNNPHFLIMQGRITKVLNMKSNEILGMIEEAAGTRMYENKRIAALKMIDKKEAKVDEISKVLEEEITPTLERLRGEKQNYLKWSKTSADVERLERFFTAYQYYSAAQALQTNQGDVQDMENEAKTLQAQADEYQSRVAEKENEIADTSAELKGDMEGTLSTAKAAKQQRSNELVRITSKWKNQRETSQKAEADVKAAETTVNETSAAVEEKEVQITDETEAMKETMDAASKAEQKLNDLNAEYQAMSAGMTKENRSLPEQISQAHADSKEAGAKVDQANLRLAHLKKELQGVNDELKKDEKSTHKLARKKEAATKKVADIKSQLAELEFTDTEYEAAEEELAELETCITDLNQRINTLTLKLRGLNFEYSDPVRGFDRSKVKGIVANLIKVKDPQHSTALEVAAGGKLFQVVVDDAITGKALLDRGKLKRRYTLIPLDKIRARHVPGPTKERAEAIARSFNTTATPAIDLVEFDEELRVAIEYVFGGTIVVGDQKAAQQICYATKTRTITLQGDVYEPSGTVSGGSKGELGKTLVQILDLSMATHELHQKMPMLKNMEGKLKAMKASAVSSSKLKVQLNVAKSELEAVEKHMSQTVYGHLIERRDFFNLNIQAAEEAVVAMTAIKDEKWQLFETLRDQEGELTQQREERLANIDDDVKSARNYVEETSKLARDAKSRLQTLSFELENLKNEHKVALAAFASANEILNEAVQKESQSQILVDDIKTQYDESCEELANLEGKLSIFSAKISELKKAKTELVRKAEAARVDAKKIAVDISRICKQRQSAEKAVATLMQKHAWIESEMEAFGIVGGDYDFTGINSSELKNQLTEMKGDHENLSKKINKKVMGMIENAENEYKELLRKRKIVENDKKKIQGTIIQLDAKKKESLQETWEKVNRDFGAVFSNLLPGTSAKLEPPEGMEVWEGLEVKVAFGGEWKESLTELSGGQRSLLALSLILSLLLFKPAPMYILDEVDAALDLSHTQNIGNMLQTHFSQSQFIVVSLKEGMFNNANVIFRTKFVDGVSTIARTIGSGSSRSRAVAHFNRNDEAAEEQTQSKVTRRPRNRGKENSC